MKHPCLVALLFSLFVAQHSLAHADPITVTVGGALDWKIPDKNAADPKSVADRAIVDAFEREHPNIRLANADGLQISGPAAESNLLMSFAGGASPDVVYVNFRSMNNYIQQGFLMPLDSYLKTNPELLPRINPVIRNVITVNGHVYAVPYAQFVMALYYRRDLFKEAGLDPDQPPRTWDEFYNDCKQITNHKTGVWGFEWPNGADGAAYWWCNLLWQAGGDVIAKNPQGQYVAAFDSPAGVKALQFYSKMISGPYVSAIDGKRYDGVANASSANWGGSDRTQGRVAMWFSYQSNIIANQVDANSINPSLIGISAMPRGPAGTANEINAAMWALSSQIKDPRVRDASWQFIQFMASDEADRIRTKSYVDEGLGNLVNPLSLEKYGYADEITNVSQSWMEANRTLFLHGHPEPNGANVQQIYQLMGQPLQAIALNPSADPAKLLADTASQVNDKLIGYVAPGVKARERAIAWTCLAALLMIGTVFGGRKVNGLLQEYHETHQKRTALGLHATNKIRNQSLFMAWMFMLPAIALIAVWSYAPLLRGMVIAFQDYKVVLGAHFVGMDNFIDCFTSSTFWRGMWNALIYTFYSLGIGFFLPVALALMLNEIPKGTVLFRTLYYLPAVTSGLVISLLWKDFEGPGNTSLLNNLLGTVHVAPQNWLGDPNWAMLAVIVPGIWASAGPGCIIYLAALKGIPTEMYEAADIDGAGVWTKVFRITMPTLKPLILINLVGATIGAFQASQNILVMTGGGPLYATHTIGLEIFYNAFLYLKFGYATAAAWIMGSLLIGFTLFQLRILRSVQFTAANA